MLAVEPWVSTVVIKNCEPLVFLPRWPSTKDRFVVLELEVFVFKLVTVDRTTAGAIVVGEVAALEHEAWNDAVEDAALVVASMVPRRTARGSFPPSWEPRH